MAMSRDSSSNPEQKRLRFLDRREPRFSGRDVIGLITLGNSGMLALLLIASILQYGAYSNLSKKAPPSLVQLETGKAITVAPLGNKERTPAVVSKFTIDTMTSMMNWSGTLPATTVEEATKPVPDPGVPITNRNKLATAAWRSGFALSEDFRKEFLVKLSEITPPGVFRGTTQVALVPIDVQAPQKISEGKWKVKMVANLLALDKGNNLGQVIPFNKEIFVQAVEAPEFTGKRNELASIIYQARSSGLEIYAIRDLSKEDL
jgi:hypothetical protein